MTLSDGLKTTVELGRFSNCDCDFQYLSEIIPSTLDCLEDEYMFRSLAIDSPFAWLGHTKSLSAWRDVLIFVNPELERQLMMVQFLIKYMVLHSLSAWERSKRLESALIPVVASILVWINDQCGICKHEDLELLRIICNSLKIQLQVNLMGIEKIAEGRDLPPDSLEDIVICTMTESPVVRTILPSQYQHRKWDQSLIKSLHFRRSLKQDLRAICLRRDGRTGVHHCDSCLCALVYYGVPDFALRLFGFMDRDSYNWTAFILRNGELWSSAFGERRPSWLLSDEYYESHGLPYCVEIFSEMLRFAFKTLRQLLQKEELCLSIEELMLHWKRWRRMLCFAICRATARVFGGLGEDEQVLSELFLECCKEVSGMVENIVVMRKEDAITRVRV
jgi:hypothetical protein